MALRALVCGLPAPAMGDESVDGHDERGRACRELAPPARSPRQKSGVARSVRADADPALRREGRSAQCQHRDDPGMGGGAAVLSPRAPRARAGGRVLGWRVRKPHDARQILGRLSVRRHGCRFFGGAGRATLLAFACALSHGPGSGDPSRSARLVDADSKRRQRSVRRECGQSHAVQRRIGEVGQVFCRVGGLHHRPFDLLRRAAPEPRGIGGYGLADRGAKTASVDLAAAAARAAGAG
jgi:hypothetical protein